MKSRKPITSTVLLLLGLLACAWLTVPAWRSVHLEGFSAQIQSIALLRVRAPGVEHDPYLPRVTQFIYETRSGVVDLLSGIFRLFPGAGDSAFRVLVFASLAALLVSSVVVAKRWARTPWMAALFALILAPGIPETAFFFNDNIVSAAFAAAALALLPRQLSWRRALVSGAFAAYAILCRLDAVFMLPMLLGAVWQGQGRPREKLVVVALGLAGALAVLAASAVGDGFSLLDSFTVARAAVSGTSVGLTHWLSVRLLFFGLPALPFLAIGAWVNATRMKQQGAYVALTTFLVYPILLIAFAPSVSEIRYILPLLAPVVAMHAGAGLVWVRDQWTNPMRGKAIAARAVAAFALVVMASPPALVALSDGPRSVLGRLWSPIRWMAWQDSITESMNRTRRLVALLDDGRENTVIVTHYNDEFYLRLRLMEAGFVPRPADSRYPGCEGFSILTHGRSTVLHVRTRAQYQVAPLSPAYSAALQITTAFRCPAVQASARKFIMTFDHDFRALPPQVYGLTADTFPGPAEIEFGDPLAFKSDPSARRYGLVMFRELTPQELNVTLAKSRQYLRDHPEGGTRPGTGMTIEEYAQAYRPLPGPTTKLLARLGAGRTTGN
jgi:hypothetical protein